MSTRDPHPARRGPRTRLPRCALAALCLLASCVAVESESPELQVLDGTQTDVRVPDAFAQQSDEAAWRLLEARGGAALLGGRFEEAHAAFSSVPATRMSPEVWPLAARAALLADAPRVARGLLHRHLREHADDALARLDMARALLLLDEHDACLKQLTLLPPLQSRAPAARELRGMALLATGSPAEALVEFRAVLAQAGDDDRVRRLAERAEARLAAARRIDRDS